MPKFRFLTSGHGFLSSRCIRCSILVPYFATVTRFALLKSLMLLHLQPKKEKIWIFIECRFLDVFTSLSLHPWCFYLLEILVMQNSPELNHAPEFLLKTNWNVDRVALESLNMKYSNICWRTKNNQTQLNEIKYFSFQSLPTYRAPRRH
jgi:hypothetical protein